MLNLRSVFRSFRIPFHWRLAIFIVGTPLILIVLLLTRLDTCPPVHQFGDVRATSGVRHAQEGGDQNVLFPVNDSSNSRRKHKNNGRKKRPFTMDDVPVDEGKMASPSHLKRETCSINDQFTVRCYSEPAEQYPYVPFSLLITFLEYSGEYDEKGIFHWYHHSISKRKLTDITSSSNVSYSTHGPFLQTLFAQYYVERRSKVKFISATHDVPISQQWFKEGHYYPIQIAQYALSHYSKAQLLTPSDNHRWLLHSGDSIEGWHMPSPSSGQRYTGDLGTALRVVFDKERLSNVLEFDITIEEKDLGIELKVETQQKSFNGSQAASQQRFTELCFDAYFTPRTDIAIALELRDVLSTRLFVHLVSGEESVLTTEHHLYLGVEAANRWHSICRYLPGDISRSKKHNLKFSRVLGVLLKGSGRIDNVTLGTPDHERHFRAGATWLLTNQDAETGGWPVTVTRYFGDHITIEPPWHSAMSQGQAMSVMMRAYLQSLPRDASGAEAFLRAAHRGLDLFQIPSSHKGVETVFMDKYVWYEEYPTQPASMVLNGFMYSLLGLWDVYSTTPDDHPEKQRANDLFSRGLHSLINLLPLYDNGFRSLYDLSHFTMGTSPRVASWDYHSVHLYQIRALYSITHQPVLKVFFDRWLGYTRGHTNQLTNGRGSN